MYRALKPLRIRNPDPTGGALQLQAGDEVPGFAGWAQWTQEAMLQQGQVRWAPEGLAPHERAATDRKVEQHMPSHFKQVAARAPAEIEAAEQENSLLRAANPRPATGEKSAPPEAVYQPDSLAAVAAEPQSAAERTEYREMAEFVPAKEGETIFASMGPAAAPPSQFGAVKEDKVPLADKGAHDCHMCDRTGFKDYNGLRIHMARAHRPQPKE